MRQFESRSVASLFVLVVCVVSNFILVKQDSQASPAEGPLSANAESGPCILHHVFEESRFTVCAVNLEQHELNLFWADETGKPYTSFNNFSAEQHSKGIRFAMNVGMFENDFRPVGLLRID